jgi:hypothetical protein
MVGLAAGDAASYQRNGDQASLPRHDAAKIWRG